jgi:hypothetical protein
MTIEIRISGPMADEELASLYQWLRAEPDVRRHALISLTSAKPQEGELGAVLDTIQMVVGDGFQLASLALAYASWQASRTKTRPDQVVSVERDGVKVSISSADPDVVERIVHELS